MDDLSLRVYLENGSDAMRGGWLELPVVPERLDAFMRGVVGVDDGGGYAVVDHEPGWFGDVLGSDLESFSVSSLNLAARCVAHARDLAVADSVDGDVFLDMLATAAESEDVRFPSGRVRADGRRRVFEPVVLHGSGEAGSRRGVERGRDAGASGFVSDHEPLAPSGPVPDGALDALEAFASGWRPPSAEASQARGAAGGADEFDTFGEPADVQDGYLPGDPADPTTMLDPSSGMGATL